MNGFTLIYIWSYSSLKNQNTIKSGLKYFRNSAGADAKTKSHFANIPRRACHCQDILYLDMSPQLLQDWHIHPTVHFQLKFVHRWWNYGRCISPLCFLWKNKSALKDRDSGPRWRHSRFLNFCTPMDTPNILPHTEQFPLRKIQKLVEWVLHVKQLRKYLH